MKKEAIVLYPSPLIGHLISMVELGRLILSHRPSATIHILISATSPSPGAAASAASTTAAYISAMSASSGGSISFHHLPANTLPPDFSVKSALPGVTIGLELLRLDTPNVRRALESISEHHYSRALIVDFFCPYALPVARELSIPCYYFFTSSAGGLASFLYFDTLHKILPKSFKDLDRDLVIDIPGVPPTQPLDMPEAMLDREDRAYEILLESARNIQGANGAIVNSFEELEPRPVRAMVEGQCTPGGTTPPLYCIGPLISNPDEGHGGHENGSKEVPECLKWLDSQPSGSVIFLCFGSMGVFPKDQLKEMAVGLERSGHRFLWVVRSPPDHPDSDFGSLFPEGFLKRTKDQGPGTRGEVMGPAGHGAEPRLSGRVRDTLRVELGPRVDHCWHPDDRMAAVCGAASDAASPGEGDRGCHIDECIGGWASDSGGGGGACPGADGLGCGEAGKGENAGDEGSGRGGAEARWIITGRGGTAS